MIQAWNKFWFSNKDLSGYKWFRYLFFLFLFFAYFERQINIEKYFFNAGLVSADLALAINQINFFFSSDFLNNSAHILFLFLLVLAAFGFGGRVVVIVATILHFAFVHRAPTIIYGFDRYAGMALFALSFINFNKADIFSNIGFNLFRIQIVVTYMFSGYFKTLSPDWWNGSALFHALEVRGNGIMDPAFIQNFPLLFKLTGWFILIYEIGSPLWLLSKHFAFWGVAVGIILHFMIAMNIEFYFGLLMSLSLVFFLADRSSDLWLLIKSKKTSV